jgi:hypothetical protein
MPQKRALSRTAPAQKHQNFTPLDIEVYAIEDGAVIVLYDQIPDHNHFFVRHHRHTR